MTNPLDNFRRDAKRLQKAFETGEREAIDRVQAVGIKGDLKRADFLHVIAREQTYRSWPAMKDAIERLGMDRAQRQQRLKIALWTGQAHTLRDIVTDDPEITDGSFGLQCALFEERALDVLQADPALATQEDAARKPMVYLAFSKALDVFPEREPQMYAIAEALVAAGASVDESFPAPGDETHPLSALYGAIGHAGNLKLGQWLLDHGANPDDNESLYHACEIGNVNGVRMLLAAGANPNGTNALKRAMDFDDLEMVQMLLDAGADPNEGTDGWTALHHAALRLSSAPVCGALIAAGADPSRIGQGITAYAAAKVYGNEALAALMDPLPLSPEEELLAQAATGKVPDSVYVDPAKLPEIYLDLVFEFSGRLEKLDHLKALIKVGMPWDRPNPSGLPPVQLAGWQGQPEMLAYFLSLKPDLGFINGYGGTLLTSIINGSENNPERADRDYLGCLELALKQGVALPRRVIKFAGEPKVKALLQEWAKAHPGQVVQHGIG